MILTPCDYHYGTLKDTVYIKDPHCKKWMIILDEKLPVFQGIDFVMH